MMGGTWRRATGAGGSSCSNESVQNRCDHLWLLLVYVLVLTLLHQSVAMELRLAALLKHLASSGMSARDI